MMAGPVSARRAEEARAAIAHHYDVGNEFYRLWLDATLSYSCALPTGPADTLEAAQERKLRHHLDAIGAADSVLDIGCGWGALLREAARTARHSAGLTLSSAQAEHIRAQRWPGVEVYLDNWMSFEPDIRFDGIVSIGAFEHFATPRDTPEQKIAVYRDFFTRCRDWLREDGALSLQTIAYANMSREAASAFMNQEIFPDADLPTLAEIAVAADGLFEVCSVRNDRLDYAWTCEQWAARLRARRAEAIALAGAEVVARYERYLRMSALGFRMGKICLLRIVLRPYGSRLFGPGGVRA
ncbi:putative mycolic acid cyclopropane synthase [Nocardia nova SH22a]|uniref:Putative mycolic acid cyclopropane synthase n=1 Tax=Nocardia nova SH22a TaxID=1415166 RepID=W5TG82_9NOCA|nr:class I SAM-dependent methyltransferase [Nocardia nova]AHH17988.1 putative mycolic acid cyclopropane synthase [Nocardia nova SH22a]